MVVVIIHSRPVFIKKMPFPSFLEDGKSIISKQIKNFDCPIYIIMGFGLDVFKPPKKEVNIIKNLNYSSTGPLYELSLLPALNDDVLLLEGSQIIPKKIIKKIQNIKQSTALLAYNNKDKQIGCTLSKIGYVENIMWNLKYRLQNTLFIKRTDFQYLQDYAGRPTSKNKFIFEGLNELLSYSKIFGLIEEDLVY